MNKLYLIFMTVLSCAMALLSCAEQKRSSTLEDTLSQYERSIRWVAFERAVAFQKDPPNTNPDQWMGIKVTSYELLSRELSNDDKRVDETVRIHYYHEANQKEQTIIDHQIWEYDDAVERWLLMTRLPDFKVAIHRGYGR